MKMTVNELITTLSQFDKDMDIYIEGQEIINFKDRDSCIQILLNPAIYKDKKENSVLDEY